jgi:hypothetical protein
MRLPCGIVFAVMMVRPFPTSTLVWSDLSELRHHIWNFCWFQLVLDSIVHAGLFVAVQF